MTEVEEKISARKERAYAKHEEELKLKSIIDDIFEEAAMLQEATFPTEEEAQEACDVFTQNSMQRLIELYDPSAIQLRIGGEGVSIPNIRVLNNPVEDSSAAITVAVDQQSPFGMLPPFEEVEAYVESVSGAIYEKEKTSAEDQPGYGVNFLMGFRLDEVETASIRLNDTSFKLVELGIIRRGFAKLTNESHLVIDVLETHREKWELIEDLAKHGMMDTVFKAHINKLAQAFHREDKSRYVEMKHVDILQRVGELGEQFARQSPQKADVVIRAILDAIGKERKLGLVYSRTLDGSNVIEVDGSVQDLLMPTSEEDDQTPTLIVGSNDAQNGQPETHYVELARIHQVSF